MILAEGRNAISLNLPSATLRWVSVALMLPLFSGIAAQRAFGSNEAGIAMGSLHRLTDTSHSSARTPPPTAAAKPIATFVTAMRPVEVPAAAGFAPLRAAGAGLAALEGPNVISVKAIIKALSLRKKAEKDVEPSQVPINGVLRIQALHLEETLSVRPFDDLLRPDPRAFADVNRLMRCRVTGHETAMDPRLVALLSQLSTYYGRTLQLISGHRAPNANGTSPTSQHTLGRAADIRVPGVTIAELKKVAIKLGARGVGLYPEKGFVHVDVRDKQRYHWVWTARGGEQADMGTSAPPKAAKHTHAHAHSEGETAHDEGGEAGDTGATSPDAELPPPVEEAALEGRETVELEPSEASPAPEASAD